MITWSIAIQYNPISRFSYELKIHILVELYKDLQKYHRWWSAKLYNAFDSTFKKIWILYPYFLIIDKMFAYSVWQWKRNVLNSLLLSCFKIYLINHGSTICYFFAYSAFYFYIIFLFLWTEIEAVGKWYVSKIFCSSHMKIYSWLTWNKFSLCNRSNMFTIYLSFKSRC